MGTLTMAAIRITAVLALAGLAQCSLPRLDVYYESLCPYSRQFIREEVYPAYNALAEYFDVFFIAYGNADTNGDLESGFTIACQLLTSQRLQVELALKNLGLTMTLYRPVLRARRDRTCTLNGEIHNS